MDPLHSPAAFRSKLVAWFKKSGRDLPWRRTTDPYAILVSEMMLQQTQVATVLAYFDRWMKAFPTLKALANASENEVLKLWQGLGYYSRARRLHRAAQEIVKAGGDFPRSPGQIASLPGVGAYTAGAVATFAFDLPAPIVDANIARVLARIFDFRSPIDSAAGNAVLWQTAKLLQPKGAGRLYNSALMELGALVCMPRTPKCETCPVQSFCKANDPSGLPVKKPRPKLVHLQEYAVYIRKKGRVLLEQALDSKWHGLWKLPAPAQPPEGPPLLRTSYPFTKHKIALLVFRAPPPKGGLKKQQQWFPTCKLDHVPMPSPHRRALERLLSAPATEENLQRVTGPNNVSQP